MLTKHILNLSSYKLSFFQKLILCRGLKFAFPQQISSIDVMASFEKAYWNLEPHLATEDMKELAATTLRSVALDYINRKGRKPTTQDTPKGHRATKKARRHSHHKTG